MVSLFGNLTRTTVLGINICHTKMLRSGNQPTYGLVNIALIKLMKMSKEHLVTFILLLVSTFTYSQKGQVIGLGYGLGNVTKSEPSFEVRDTMFSELHLKGEWVTETSIVVGFEVHKSIGKELRYIDARVKGGANLFKTNRLQIPLSVYFGYYNLSQNKGPKYGNVTYGISGGLRFYLTNISIQGTFDYGSNLVSQIDDQEFNDPPGNFRRFIVHIGVNYYLKNKAGS